MHILFGAIAVAIVGSILRLSRSRGRRPDFDTYGHLYFAHVVGCQRVGPFGSIRANVVGASEFSYPFLWHWLLGHLSAPVLLRHQGWLNPIADLVFTLILFSVGVWLGMNPTDAVIASVLYLLTPMWFSEVAIGPRLASLTPRLASEIATNLFLVITLLPLGLPPWAVLAAGTTLAATVVMMSKFGLQALVLLVPLTSVFVRSPIPVAALLLGFGFSIVISRGRVLKMVRDQLSHLKWYWRKNRQGQMSVSNRNSIEGFKRAWSQGAGMTSSLLRLVHHATAVNSFTGVIIKMPILLVSYFVLFFPIQEGAGGAPAYLWGPVVAATIVFFAVNTRHLLFLGEAERYLNHVAAFIVIWAAFLYRDLDTPWIFWCLAAWGTAFWLMEILGLHRIRQAFGDGGADDDDHIVEALRQRSDSGTVLCYPYSAGGGVYRIMLETPHKVVFVSMVSTAFLNEFEREYAADYPYVRLERLDEMADALDVNLLVVDKPSLARRGKEGWEPSSPWRPIESGSKRSALYERPIASGRDLAEAG